MQDRDPLVRGMDRRIRIRIHTKMSWIRNTGINYHLFFRRTFRRISRRRRTRQVDSSSGSVTRRRCWCCGSRPTQPVSIPTTRNGAEKNIVFFIQTCCHLFLLSKISHSSDDGCSHRVGRVLKFSPVVAIGTPPTPHPRASCAPSPLVPGGGAHSLAREGLGESQFRRGDVHCGTIYIYVLCGCR
jgi:hypothetical protein